MSVMLTDAKLANKKGTNLRKRIIFRFEKIFLLSLIFNETKSPFQK